MPALDAEERRKLIAFETEVGRTLPARLVGGRPDGLIGPVPYAPPRWGLAEDHLPTELFMRYGSTERGKYRSRQEWVDDASAIRAVMAEERRTSGEPGAQAGPMLVLLTAIGFFALGMAVAGVSVVR